MAYVGNTSGDSVSVINTFTNARIRDDVAVGNGPRAVAVMPNGTGTYVANFLDDDLSVLSTLPIAKIGLDIPVGNWPGGVAFHL